MTRKAVEPQSPQTRNVRWRALDTIIGQLFFPRAWPGVENTRQCPSAPMEAMANPLARKPFYTTADPSSPDARKIGWERWRWTPPPPKCRAGPGWRRNVNAHAFTITGRPKGSVNEAARRRVWLLSKLVSKSYGFITSLSGELYLSKSWAPQGLSGLISKLVSNSYGFFTSLSGEVYYPNTGRPKGSVKICIR